MNRIADLLEPGALEPGWHPRFPGCWEPVWGEAWSLGLCMVKWQWQSRTVNGCPRPYRPFQEKRIGRPSKREEIKLFFSYNCFRNCLTTQLYTAILCCLEFPSQLPIRSDMKRDSGPGNKLYTVEAAHPRELACWRKLCHIWAPRSSWGLHDLVSMQTVSLAPFKGSGHMTGDRGFQPGSLSLL